MLDCEELDWLCAASLENTLDTEDTGALEASDATELLEGRGELLLAGESSEGAAPPQLASHSVRLIRAPLAKSGCLMLLLTSGRSMPSFLIMRNTATFNSRT